MSTTVGLLASAGLFWPGGPFRSRAFRRGNPRQRSLYMGLRWEL